MSVHRWLSVIGDSALPSALDRSPSVLAPSPQVPAPPLPPSAPECPFLDWASSGAMALTVDENGAPVLSPGTMWPLLDQVGRALTWLSGETGRPVPVDPALLLTGRAGLRNLTGRGRTSAGGATRLLRTAGGWCALTLGRPDDLELVPAILGRADVADPWPALAAAARDTTAPELAAHIRVFGLPCAPLPPEPPPVDVPWLVSRIAMPDADLRLDGAVVVDLSALWAGPLCAHLLGRAGARVIKVESTRRPDGARAGNRHFYDWLHAGHESVALDFSSDAGRSALAELVNAADIVVEASRPRALAQLGLAAERLDHRAGKVWVSITGYGRGHPDRVAFGDDAAVAGGLVGRTGTGPVFCADAIADPLTGLVAALGVMGSVAGGGGQLLDVSMRDVAAAFAGVSFQEHGPHRVRDGAVECAVSGRSRPVLPPRVPGPVGRAVAMGADTARVLAEVPAGRDRGVGRGRGVTRGRGVSRDPRTRPAHR
ncbi:CoA transferase [Streptomyces sp. NPDC005648]|uniref:CoA transferase n=1 Tax=Streptomyces sp. NPDC005648 TaxID=3157044 RepID=UPI0033A0E76B